MPSGRQLTSEELAALIVDALVEAELVPRAKFEEAVRVVTEEIDARKAVQDY